MFIRVYIFYLANICILGKKRNFPEPSLRPNAWDSNINPYNWKVCQPFDAAETQPVTPWKFIGPWKMRWSPLDRSWEKLLNIPSLEAFNLQCKPFYDLPGHYPPNYQYQLKNCWALSSIGGSIANLERWQSMVNQWVYPIFIQCLTTGLIKLHVWTSVWVKIRSYNRNDYDQNVWFPG